MVPRGRFGLGVLGAGGGVGWVFTVGRSKGSLLGVQRKGGRDSLFELTGQFVYESSRVNFHIKAAVC